MSNLQQAMDPVYSLAVSPALHGRPRMCLAGKNSGLFLSDDAAISWTSIYDRLKLDALVPVLAAAFSPDYEGDHSLFTGVAGNAFLSESGGERWRGLALASPLPTISSIIVSPAYAQDGFLLYGTVEDGLFASYDRGMHWQSRNFGLMDLNVLCLAASPDYSNDGTLLVGTETGLFRSKNNARAWREVNLPFDYEPIFSSAFSPFYAADETIFAGTESHGLIVSHDRGKTWAELGSSAPQDVVISLFSLTTPQGGFGLVAVAENQVYYSPDAGAHWQLWNHTATIPQDISAAALLESNQILLGTGSGAIFTLPAD